MPSYQPLITTDRRRLCKGFRRLTACDHASQGSSAPGSIEIKPLRQSHEPDSALSPGLGASIRCKASRHPGSEDVSEIRIGQPWSRQTHHERRGALGARGWHGSVDPGAQLRPRRLQAMPARPTRPEHKSSRLAGSGTFGWMIAWVTKMPSSAWAGRLPIGVRTNFVPSQ